MQKDKVGFNIYTFQYFNQGINTSETALINVNWYLTGSVDFKSLATNWICCKIISWIVVLVPELMSACRYPIKKKNIQTIHNSCIHRIKPFKTNSPNTSGFVIFLKDTLRMFAMLRIAEVAYWITRQLSKRRRFLVNNIYRGLCLGNIRLKHSDVLWGNSPFSCQFIFSFLFSNRLNTATVSPGDECKCIVHLMVRQSKRVGSCPSLCFVYFIFKNHLWGCYDRLWWLFFLCFILILFHFNCSFSVSL